MASESAAETAPECVRREGSSCGGGWWRWRWLMEVTAANTPRLRPQNRRFLKGVMPAATGKGWRGPERVGALEERESDDDCILRERESEV